MAKKKQAEGPDEFPPELEADEIQGMDGALARDTKVYTYPAPAEVVQQVDYAVRFLNTKFYHTNVALTDFDMAAYEQPAKGTTPKGAPDYLAFRHKKTGKSRAGFGLYVPDPIPHYGTASVLIDELAKEDKA